MAGSIGYCGINAHTMKAGNARHEYTLPIITSLWIWWLLYFIYLFFQITSWRDFSPHRGEAPPLPAESVTSLFFLLVCFPFLSLVFSNTIVLVPIMIIPNNHIKLTGKYTRRRKKQEANSARPFSSNSLRPWATGACHEMPLYTGLGVIAILFFFCFFFEARVYYLFNLFIPQFAANEHAHIFSTEKKR